MKVYAPLKAREKYIHEVIDDKTPWIVKSITRLEKRRVLPAPLNYISGEKISYLGKEYILRVITGKRGPSELLDDSLIIRTITQDENAVRRSLDKWYRSRAREVFTDCIRRCIPAAFPGGIGEPLLSIRLMKRRWGICRPSGKITLNLRLIQMPLICVEFIVMHEICHLKHPDHSGRFYSFLSECMPDWKERKKLLDDIRLIY